MARLDKITLSFFSETQVVNTFGLSYLEVRQAKRKFGLSLEDPVSHGCLQEIAYLHDEEPISVVCNKYKCDPLDVHRARYRLPKKEAYTRPKASEIVPWLATGLPHATIADALGCSARYVSAVAKAHADMFPVRSHTTLSAEQQTELVEKIKSGEYTQQELADMYGVSQSTVSQLNPDKQTRKQYKRIDEETWQKIRKALLNKEAGVSELARKFNVSRGGIYQKIYSRGLYNDKG